MIHNNGRRNKYDGITVYVNKNLQYDQHLIEIHDSNLVKIINKIEEEEIYITSNYRVG